MTNRTQWIAVLGIVATLIGALILGVAMSPEVTPVSLGTQAPEFRAARLGTGDTVRLADYAGEVVLFNIWATWCGPCEFEMPSMERLYQELRPHGLKIVAMSVDEAGPDHVLAWVNERNLTFEILHDRSGQVEAAYQVTGYPESFVINRDGIIVKKVIGPLEWDHPTQRALFRQLLGVEEDGQVATGGF
jgi:peroxiredoxin